MQLFWFSLSIEILWVIWKARNEDKFNGSRRTLIESTKRLIMFNIAMQVIVPMEVSEGKSLRLLRDGHPWQHNQPNLSILMKAHEALQKEFTEKSEKGKKDQGTKGPKLHTNEDHVIEEVQSNDEMIAVEALMSWRSCETGSGSRKS